MKSIQNVRVAAKSLQVSKTHFDKLNLASTCLFRLPIFLNEAAKKGLQSFRLKKEKQKRLKRRDESFGPAGGEAAVGREQPDSWARLSHSANFRSDQMISGQRRLTNPRVGGSVSLTRAVE